MGEAGVTRWAVRAGAVAALASSVAGCASYLPVDQAGRRTALPPAAAAAATPGTPATSPMPQAYAPPVASPATSGDTCGAGALQYLVGKTRTEIPVPTDPDRRRVVCTTCPMTQDVRPDRQTVRYDAATNKVVGVTCG